MTESKHVTTNTSMLWKQGKPEQPGIYQVRYDIVDPQAGAYLELAAGQRLYRTILGERSWDGHSWEGEQEQPSHWRPFFQQVDSDGKPVRPLVSEVDPKSGKVVQRTTSDEVKAKISLAVKAAMAKKRQEQQP